jgi:hypothetical protein
VRNGTPTDSGSSPCGDAPNVKHSYTIPCSSAFRDAVETLAASRRVNVGDIARSVLLVMPDAVIAGHPDPGEPAGDDRESVILKSGPAQGRPWRRKPRLQVRMAPGYDIAFIRKALALALAMGGGAIEVRLHSPADAARELAVAAATPSAEVLARIDGLHDEIERMKAVIAVLAFEPLAEGVATRDQALHVLGFPPGARPDRRALRAKFRMLATIHHPDSNYGSHHRMSQLNQAMEILRDWL